MSFYIPKQNWFSLTDIPLKSLLSFSVCYNPNEVIEMRYTERIRDLRKEKRYTQTYVANVLQVAQTTYSDYENGRVRIPVNHIVELARFYDISLNYITGVSNIREPFPRWFSKEKDHKKPCSQFLWYGNDCVLPYLYKSQFIRSKKKYW